MNHNYKDPSGMLFEAQYVLQVTTMIYMYFSISSRHHSGIKVDKNLML